jgi:hypothetical protein
MKTGGTATKALLTLFGFATACDFDGAFNRYCENNPHCQADAGPTLEVGAEVGLEVGAEVGLEVGAEVGAEVGQISEVNDAELKPLIPPPKNCTSPNDCSSPDEFCHPINHVCMKTCNSLTDCQPWPWLGSCSDTPGGPTHGPKVCSCTFQSCNNYSNLLTCNPSGGLCERVCGTDQDCSGFQPPRICDLPTGLCQPIPRTCSGNTDCPPAQPRCDPASSLCTRCVSPADCAGRPDGSSQCSPAGICVGPQPGN